MKVKVNITALMIEGINACLGSNLFLSTSSKGKKSSLFRSFIRKPRVQPTLLSLILDKLFINNLKNRLIRKVIIPYPVHAYYRNF